MPIEETKSDGSAAIQSKEEPQYSADVIEIATEMGWKPKEEFSGPDEKYVDPKTYVRNLKPINDTTKNTVKSLKAQNTAMMQEIRSLKTSYEKTQKAQVTAEIGKLEKERMEAIAAGDVDAVTDIEKTINEVKTTVVETPVVHEGFAAWKDENDWYEENQALTDIADGFAGRLSAEGKSMNQILATLEKEMPQYVARFQDEGKLNGNDVQGAGSSHVNKGGGGKTTMSDLTPEEQVIVKRFSDTGAITPQAYIDQLVENGTLPKK